MLEISAYLNNFDLHKKSYTKIQEELVNLYQDYVNSESIVSLFEYWLFSLSTLHRCYGDSGLRQFLCSRYHDPIAYSYFNEFDIQQSLPHDLTSNQKLVLCFDKYFPIQYRLPSSPSTGIFSKLLVRYTKALASQIPTTFDSTLVSKILGITNKYLSCLGINLIGTINDRDIPAIFISRQIRCNNLREIELYCAPIEMLQFRKYECIFLLNRKVNVIGCPHGGGYDVASNDPLTYFEKRISNSFFGWGFSERNTHQTRYSADGNIKKKSKDRRVIWIESSDDSKFTAYCYPLLFTVKKDADIPIFIHHELAREKVNYFSKKYPGKLESNRYQGFRGTVIPFQQSAEELLGQGDVVIFDNCMHSLIYFCLENNILFLIVEKREAIEHFTQKMLDWYKILRKSNLLFHDDEHGHLGKKIKSLDMHRSLPNGVSLYYKNIFNLSSED